MRHITRIKDIPLFPIIPFVPIGLFLTSVGLTITALIRLRRLEDRVATAGVTFGAE